MGWGGGVKNNLILITGDGHTIHTIVVRHPEAIDDAVPIVLMHGYGMGSGGQFLIQNFGVPTIGSRPSLPHLI